MNQLPSILSHGFCPPIHPDLLNVGCCPLFDLQLKLSHKTMPSPQFGQSTLCVPNYQWWEAPLYRYRWDYYYWKNQNYTVKNILVIKETERDFFMGTTRTIQDVSVKDESAPTGDCTNPVTGHEGPICNETYYFQRDWATCNRGTYNLEDEVQMKELQTPESAKALALARWGWTTAELNYNPPLKSEQTISSGTISNRRTANGFIFSEMGITAFLFSNSALKVTQPFRIKIQFNLELNFLHTNSPYTVPGGSILEIYIPAGNYHRGMEFRAEAVIEPDFGFEARITSFETNVEIEN